jgi:hypothetical protein
MLSAPPTDRVGIDKRRKAFVKGIRNRWGRAVYFVARSEVGPINGRWHDHYLMVSDGVEVSPADVEAVWRKACGGEPGAKVHQHEPPRDIRDACRYLFKSDGKFHDPANPKCVVLFAKDSPNITWGSRFFPEKERERLWRERYPASESEGDAGPTPHL